MADLQSGAAQVQGEAAENAAAAGNPVLVGGRFDATPRTLGDTDVGGIALDADGAVQIADGGNSITIDGSVSVTGSATVVGDIADDGADSGNPVKIGAVMKNFDKTDPGSLSAENDRGNLTMDNNRRLYVNDVHANHWTVLDNNATAQTNKALLMAPGAGLRYYITDIILSTDAAMNIELNENTSSPVVIAGPYYFAANGGIAAHFKTPIALTANEELSFTSSAAGNHTIQVHGFIAP